MHSLGVIRGIGIAVEDRLCRAGVKSCNQLVDTSPSEIGEMLGYLAQGSDIERWIEQAGGLIREHAYCALSQRNTPHGEHAKSHD